jgi:hypothetical protein
MVQSPKTKCIRNSFSSFVDETQEQKDNLPIVR